MPPHTRILSGDDARRKIKMGVDLLAEAIRGTLGPSSRRVLMGRSWGLPVACDDGVTIAKAIHLEDPEESLGAQMIREAASRTGDLVGDGTTTSVILAHAIFSEGLRNVVAGTSAAGIKRGLDRGLRVALAQLQSLAQPVTDRRDTAHVAALSAHGDRTIGEIVADAIDRVGHEGAVSVEEARGTESALEVVEGLVFERGFLSPYFITDPTRQEAVLVEPMVLIYDKKIHAMTDLLPLLEQVVKTGRPLVIIAEDVDGDALATLVVNKLRGTFECVAVKAPGFGDRRMAMLEDIAIVTGGRLISDDVGAKLANVAIEDLGSAARVVVGRNHTTLVGGKGTSESITNRCAQLRDQIDEAKSDYDREKLQERLAKLSGGVAVIRVGAPSEAEMKLRKEAFDDAISATRAALAEGIVPGGGLALLRAIPVLERAEADAPDEDTRTGMRILRRALEAPTRQIAVNSNVDPGVVVSSMMAGTGNLGFDGVSGEYVDLVEAGIIDPVKVVRVALENAVSVAGVLLLANATLTEIETEPPGGPSARAHDLM